MTKRILDDETRRKLSGLLPFAPGSFLPFTPEAFQKVEESLRPIFHLRPFAEKDRAYLRQHLASGTFDTAAIAAALSNSAIVTWSNLIEITSGELLEYSKDAVGTLPDALIHILFDRVQEFSNGPTEIEKEGLESKPLPASESLSNTAQGAAAPLA